MNLFSTATTSKRWLEDVGEALRYEGCAIVEGVLPAGLLQRTREALYRVRDRIVECVGEENLKRAGETGTLRLPMMFEPVFFEYLALPEVLAVVDSTIGDTAILHLQNGFILPPAIPQAERIFQTTFHRDFPRYLNGYVASVNVFFAIDDFNEANGATVVVPGTQQRVGTPDEEYLGRAATVVEAPAGAMLVFDSTLWHAAGENRSGADRLALNHQFTRSYIKQQIDYVRALGEETILQLPPRSQQLLGWYTRVVTSLDEYYRPEEERLYRRGQG